MLTRIYIYEVCDMYMRLGIVSYVYMYEGVVYVLVSVDVRTCAYGKYHVGVHACGGMR